MKAMVLAAGLGTRLKPITENKPKALVEVNGITLLELAIKRLIKSGFNEIIINVHYFSGQIISFLKEKNNFGIRIEISDESELLLDTGGGIKNAKWFFDDEEPFIVYNVDILTNLNLNELYNSHLNSILLITLSVSQRKSSRYLLFDENMILCGWENVKTGEKKIPVVKHNLQQFAYNGIQIMNPEIFNLFPDEKVFSIIDVFLNLSEKYEIKGYFDKEAKFLDVGKIENLREAKKFN